MLTLYIANDGSLQISVMLLTAEVRRELGPFFDEALLNRKHRNSRFLHDLTEAHLRAELQGQIGTDMSIASLEYLGEAVVARTVLAAQSLEQQASVNDS